LGFREPNSEVKRARSLPVDVKYKKSQEPRREFSCGGHEDERQGDDNLWHIQEKKNSVIFSTKSVSFPSSRL